MTDDERLGVHRAIIGAAIEAAARVDDSFDRLGQHFREAEPFYLDLAQHYFERPQILRDLLELATWEDHGLFTRLESFLTELPEPTANLASRELADIIRELNHPGLEYQRTKARRLRGLVIQSANRFGEEEAGDGVVA